jgi:hypothetical protein
MIPLLAMDELPTWLQVGNWDWSDPTLFHSMVPASIYQVPRIGEYDVICHYCCSGLELLQRSISQHSDNPSVRPQPHPIDDRRSFPGAFRDPTRDVFPTFPGYQHYSIYADPAFQPSLRQNPYTGFCWIDWRSADMLYSSQSTSPWTSSFWSPPNPIGRVDTQKDQPGRPPCLNPDAYDFRPPESKIPILTPSSSSREDEFKATIFSPNSGWTSLSSGPRRDVKPPVTDTGIKTEPPGEPLVKVEDLGLQSSRDVGDMVSSLKQVLGIAADQKDLQIPKHTRAGAENNGKDKVYQSRRYIGARSHGHPVRKGKRARRGRVRVRHPIRKGEISTGEEGHSKKGSSPATRRRRAVKMRRRHSEGERRSRYWQVMQSPNWRQKAGQGQ